MAAKKATTTKTRKSSAAEKPKLRDASQDELLGYYRAGKFPFDRMVRRYPFAEINTAVGDHAAGRAVKAVLVME